jgi:hypothetical protein
VASVKALSLKDTLTSKAATSHSWHVAASRRKRGVPLTCRKQTNKQTYAWKGSCTDKLNVGDFGEDDLNSRNGRMQQQQEPASSDDKWWSRDLAQLLPFPPRPNPFFLLFQNCKKQLGFGRLRTRVCQTRKLVGGGVRFETGAGVVHKKTKGGASVRPFLEYYHTS